MRRKLRFKPHWLLYLVFIYSVSFGLFADVHVSGYYRKDGTYVRPHYRSSPDGITSNNYSARGISKVHSYCGSHGTYHTHNANGTFSTSGDTVVEKTGLYERGEVIPKGDSGTYFGNESKITTYTTTGTYAK